MIPSSETLDNALEQIPEEYLTFPSPAEGEEDFYVELVVREKVTAHSAGAAVDALCSKRLIENTDNPSDPFTEVVCRVARTPFYD